MRRAPDKLVANTPPIVPWPASPPSSRPELDAARTPASGRARRDASSIWRERRAGAGRHDHLGRLIERDAAQALVDTVAAVCTGRPIPALGAAAASPRAACAVAAASASTRENSRSSTGRIWLSTVTAASRGLSRPLAAVERKHLGRIEQPFGIEHGLDPHLHVEVGSVNCTRIRSRFSMPTPCSPVRQPPTATHSSRISCARLLGPRRPGAASLAS